MSTSTHTKFSPIAFDVSSVSSCVAQVAFEGGRPRLHAAASLSDPLRERPADDSGCAKSWERAARAARQRGMAGNEAVWLIEPPDVMFVPCGVPATLLETPKAQRQNALRGLAARELQRDADTLIVDHWVPPAPRNTAAGTVEIIVAAAAADTVEDCARFLESHGFSLVEVDVAPLALLRAAGPNWGAANSRSLSGILDIGFSGSLLTLSIGGQCVYVRNLTVCGDAMTLALVDAFEIPYGAAETLKRHYGVSCGDGHGTETAGAGRLACLPRALGHAVAATLRNELRILASEIESAFKYAMQLYPDAPPGEPGLALTGGAARMRGLEEFLGEQLGIAVSPLRLDANFTRGQRGPEHGPVNSAECAAAVGAALGAGA